MAEHFEQKPESSGDSTVELDNFCRNFAFRNATKCWHCNTFIEPSNDDPVCVPCHKFIFPSRKRKNSGNVLGEPSAQPSSPPSSRADEKLKDSKKVSVEMEANQSTYETCLEGENTAAARNKCINDLPADIFEKILSHLDYKTLFTASKVSKQWQKIVDSQQKKWEMLTKKRWPLLNRSTEKTNWLKMYAALNWSCFCRFCWNKTIQKSNSHERPIVNRRVERELIRGSESSDIRFIALNEQLTYFQCSIAGPPDSPYAGGIFYLTVHLPQIYPHAPPIIKFLTKIIHPNISRHGDIGLDTLTHNHRAAMTIFICLLSIQCLMSDPFTEVCMEPELGHLYDNDRRRFDALARYWTKKYATMDRIIFDD